MEAIDLSVINFLPYEKPNLNIIEENELLRKEIQVAREAADITANLVVKQFEETEKILHRFQVANAQRKAVLDSAADISIIATNKKGVISVFNTGAEKLLRYSAEELIGKATPEIFHLDSELELLSKKLYSRYGSMVEGLDVLFEYAAREESDQIECMYIRKDGSQFPVRMIINTLREPYDDIGGLLCIAMDVTEKKRSEKALKESERKYRLLIRSIPNIVYRGDIDGSLDFFDNKIEKITGYKKEDFLSRKKNWFDIVYKEDLEMAKKSFKEAMKTDNAYIREYRVQSKDGKIAWIQEGSQIIYGENGEIEFITGAFLDITERKLAEQALHESEEKYRSLFDSGPTPIFVIDGHTKKILDANTMAEETYGYSKQDLIGRPITDLGPVEDIYTHLDTYDEKDWPKACVVKSNIRHYKKGNKPFYVRVTACPISYKNRDSIILAVTDITETLEKDAQLLQASKMTTLGEMSAGIAHELNQPLNAIKMGNEYIKMMIDKGTHIPEKELLKVSSHVSDQVDRAAEIINRLRDFGRKPDLAFEKVDINNPVRAVSSIVNQQLALQNIKVRVKLEENLPPILANNNHLEQVIFNLVTNARDAIYQKKGEGSQAGEDVIAIRTFTENDRVVIAVSDTGIGMPDDIKDKIFEPFYTTKEVGEGMGLGLYITYGIVKNYNGEIEILSEEGRGSTFKLTFPYDLQ